MLRELPDLARQALFRPRCRICGAALLGREEAVVCGDCLAAVKPEQRPACPRCGLFRDSAGICGNCRLDPPPWESHRSFAAYQGVLRQLIVLYKYGEIEALKAPLGDCLLRRLELEAAGPFDLVVPVPPDPGRRREFHPPAELARKLARSLGLPLAAALLHKTRSTPAQAGLSRDGRLRNLRRAFRLGRAGGLKGRRVLLVDDVFTTGATLRACAAQLSKAGAEVTAFTVAQSVWQADATLAPAEEPAPAAGVPAAPPAQSPPAGEIPPVPG